MLDLIEREPAEGSEGGVENLVGRVSGAQHRASQLLYSTEILNVNRNPASH